MCPISYAFGAYRDDQLVGIVTYGSPISSTLRTGVCGVLYEQFVLELNRLVCENSKNMASILVGRSLQLLPKPSVVVSYADTSQGHVGYVYQATNFLYTGLSKPMSDPMVEGMEHMHHTAISDAGRGQNNRAEFLRQQYGDKLYLKPRAQKHRYIYLCGDKKEKKALQNALCYDIIPYPKGSTTRYDAGPEVATQQLLL
jgi:hypothetical protein